MAPGCREEEGQGGVGEEVRGGGKGVESPSVDGFGTDWTWEGRGPEVRDFTAVFVKRRFAFRQKKRRKVASPSRCRGGQRRRGTM